MSAASENSVESTRRAPELLAPAGNWVCARAAAENGADAIYFGLGKFNARMRAQNFHVADLPELMAFLHERGVRGYVTFNTLVFSDELEQAESFLRSIIAAGVDAAIVQDVGICRLIRRISPDFPIHASTQMTISSAAGVEFARGLGCDLVVLARECSLAEIEKIREVTSAVGGSIEMPLEVFVHGALCVAYSGQCLTSESLGGRSANRGECAQACRMPYGLVVDGETRDLGDKRYLLSPQDLAGIEVLPELVHAGVASLKIEGRLKSPEYVANITRVYRRAIDEALGADQDAFRDTVRSTRYDLEMGFSRGLYTGWFRGIHNQELAHARFGKKRGVLVGAVEKVRGDSVFARMQAPLKPGDGVVFDAGNPDAGEEGGRVYSVDREGGSSKIRFGKGAVRFQRIAPGNLIWKTSDPELDRDLRKTFETEKPRFQRPVHAEVHGREGTALTLILADTEGHTVSVESDARLEAARTSPLDDERLRGQLGRLGGTPFRLDHLSNQLEGTVILPVSELNRVRRDAVEKLTEIRRAPKRWTLHPASEESHVSAAVETRGDESAFELSVLVRDLAQIAPSLEAGVCRIYCDFENPKTSREAVVRVREFNEANPSTTAEVFVAPPRIFKTGEEYILKQVASSEPDGILVRNHDHLRYFKGSRMIGDFSLNVANHLSAECFKRDHGLELLTASYDLNLAQLEALLRAAPADWFEITIHQHMPMFHMEHCVFCAFMSTGKDYRDCGRPCEEHEVRLRDRVGEEHRLKADAGCRNTLFNARAQTGAEYAQQMLALGARRFRVALLDESPEQTGALIGRYQQLLRGEVSGRDLWSDFRLKSQLGVTRGQIEREESSGWRR